MIKTARRVFEVLDCFRDARRPLGLKEVAERCGYPTSSAAALLKSLTELGYLDYDRFSRSYFPTMRIVVQGEWVEEALFGDDPILGQMRRMSALTSETVTLATQSDLHTQYVYGLQSPLPRSHRIEIGGRRLLAESALGWLLLSLREDAQVALLIRRMNAHLAPLGGRVDAPALWERIAEARRDGHAVSRNVLVAGAGGISFPLPPTRQGRQLALGVHAPVDRLDAKLGLIIAEMRDFSARHG